MYPNTVDPFTDHLDLVRAVTDAGIPPPQQWTETLARFDAFTALQFPIRQRLADAITNGGTDDVALLKAAAAGEEIGAAGNQTTAYVENQVLRRLREIYADVAADNYTAIAAQFDKAATKFTELAATCDVEGDAASMLAAPDKVRKAFLDAESFANQINRLLPALAASATLARGVDVFLGNQLIMLPLCVNVDGHKRRDIWTAWDHTTGRTARWGALVRIGVPIQARALDQPLAEYRRPLPLERRQRQVPGQPRGIIEQYMYDPEDEQPEPFDPIIRRPSGRVVTA
jgi:hypothetical protein